MSSGRSRWPRSSAGSAAPTPRGNRSHSTRRTLCVNSPELHAAERIGLDGGGEVGGERLARLRSPRRPVSPRAACPRPSRRRSSACSSAARRARCSRCGLLVGGRALVLGLGDGGDAEHERDGAAASRIARGEGRRAPRARRDLADQEARDLEQARQRLVAIGPGAARHPRHFTSDPWAVVKCRSSADAERLIELGMLGSGIRARWRGGARRSGPRSPAWPFRRRGARSAKAGHRHDRRAGGARGRAPCENSRLVTGRGAVALTGPLQRSSSIAAR